MTKFILVIFSVLSLTSFAQNVPFEAFEFHAKGSPSDWWQLKLFSDSTFVFESLDHKTYDSTASIIIDSTAIIVLSDKGRWKKKGSDIVLYEIENTEKNLKPNFPFLNNSRWTFKKEKLYNYKSFRTKIYFTKIKS